MFEINAKAWNVKGPEYELAQVMASVAEFEGILNGLRRKHDRLLVEAGTAADPDVEAAYKDVASYVLELARAKSLACTLMENLLEDYKGGVQDGK